MTAPPRYASAKSSCPGPFPKPHPRSTSQGSERGTPTRDPTKSSSTWPLAKTGTAYLVPVAAAWRAPDTVAGVPQPLGEVGGRCAGCVTVVLRRSPIVVASIITVGSSHLRSLAQAPGQPVDVVADKYPCQCADAILMSATATEVHMSPIRAAFPRACTHRACRTSTCEARNSINNPARRGRASLRKRAHPLPRRVTTSLPRHTAPAVEICAGPANPPIR